MSKRLVNINMKAVCIFMVVVMLMGLATTINFQEVSASNPTLEDLWDGNAHFELYMNRPMDGQAASGSNVVVVGNTWYWFHRKVHSDGTLGTVCEKSTDKGQTWSEPVDVLVAESGTPWEKYVTDGSFWYDSTNNKWRALMQTTDGSNPWTMSYFERDGSDPMGAFTTPTGFTNPGCDAKEIWSQLTTTSGRDCVDIPGGTNLVYDEGTPQIVEKVGDYWYVTFHGASNNDGVIHGYRGLAKTTDFQNWTALADDCIIDEYDADDWEVEWNNSNKAIGAGAANLMKEGSYYYQIIECPDVDLNGHAGQNWPMHVLRSTTLENTSWQQCPNTYPILPATGQLIEWQYPTFFKDADGVTYLAASLYAPNVDSGFRIYKLVSGGGPTTPARLPSNIMINPSFENSGYAWNLDSSASFSTDRAHSGFSSLKITQSGHNAKTYKKMYVLPNTDYIISGYIYKSSNNGSAYFDFNDIPGDVQPTVADGSGGGDWTFVSEEWNSGSNSWVEIRCVADGSIDGPVYFDDVSFVRKDSMGFETGQVKPTWSDSIEESQNVSGYFSGIDPECSIRQDERSKTGSSALMFSGNDDSTSVSYCKYKVFDVDIAITSTTELSYWFYPEDTNAKHVTVDFVCTDGSTLSGSSAVDQNNIGMDPSNARGTVNTWNYVECNVGQWLNGKTIDKILVYYNQGPSTGQYRGYIDDISIVSQTSAAEQLVLSTGQTLESEGEVKARSSGRLINQSDGNLVIYSGGDAVWATDTNGEGASHLVMQTDGNLVLYRNSGGASWASNTAGTIGDYYCTLANGGTLKVYSGTYPNGTQIWSSN